MKFCTVCSSIMFKKIGASTITFICNCGNKEIGTGKDTRIYIDRTKIHETFSKYKQLLKNIPFDNVTNIVDRPCQDCGVPFMKQIILNSDTIYVCKCQHLSV